MVVEQSLRRNVHVQDIFSRNAACLRFCPMVASLSRLEEYNRDEEKRQANSASRFGVAKCATRRADQAKRERFTKRESTSFLWVPFLIAECVSMLFCARSSERTKSKGFCQNSEHGQRMDERFPHFPLKKTLIYVCFPHTSLVLQGVFPLSLNISRRILSSDRTFSESCRILRTWTGEISGLVLWLLQLSSCAKFRQHELLRQSNDFARFLARDWLWPT
jgi:hypothetical protein